MLVDVSTTCWLLEFLVRSLNDQFSQSCHPLIICHVDVATSRTLTSSTVVPTILCVALAVITDNSHPYTHDYHVRIEEEVSSSLPTTTV